MDFVKENEELRFVALIQSDTQWNQAHTAHTIKDSVIVSFPDDKEFSIDLKSNDSLIVIRAPFRSSIMNGDIMLVVSTDSINKKQKKIWLSRSISHPVQALRKAAKRVGEGDLTSIVENNSKDEIGELATAFNSMVKDIKKLSELTLAQEKEKQAMLASQNEALEKEVAERTKELRQSLVDLKATQSQLIQSEKMASLGELTAGIAHEIQNPLNFVNNFSEVNKELLDEMNEEIDKGNYEEVKIIAKDVTDNQEKINYHGKRADAIVKGMLQHSRSSSGQKEPTDINGLADEYLRLAYHGLRAKDKTFNATLKTEYDASIGNINIIPQDMGRVILNLITNAFYVVKEKKRETPNGYEPTVTVTTRKTKDKIIISVKDNGKGIPQKIVDKIFQPFFTTKPTGLGTGLGLSLSYDIVKAHGGELKVETKEGEGAEFIIILPS